MHRRERAEVCVRGGGDALELVKSDAFERCRSGGIVEEREHFFRDEFNRN